jgi:RNA polymerase sigma-70 factor (ECF subfamily)
MANEEESKVESEKEMNFDEAYVKYYSQIDRYIFKRVYDPDITEDLVQETFLKAWRNWEKAEYDHLQAWLYRIAINTVIDYTRKYKACSLDKLLERGMEFPDATEFEGQCEASDTIRYLLSSKIGKQVEYLIADDQCASGEELGRLYGTTTNNAKTKTYRARIAVRKFREDVA